MGEDDKESESNANVASMPANAPVNEEDDFDKFKSSLLGKHHLEDFVEQQTANKKVASDQLMPFLNIDNGDENAVTTEGILPLVNILELPGMRTCGRCRESSAMSVLPLLHIQQKDKWSCGYRNLQMLLSALIPQLPSDHPYHTKVPANLKRSDLGVAVPIPSLKDLQEFLEAAWKMGLDPRGSQFFGGKIVGKPAEIGAVEVSSILGSLLLDSVVVQFIKTQESRDLLGHFVWSYFGKRAECDCLEPRNSARAAEDLLEYATTLPKEEVESRICTCPTIPLYLQWEGHSVTIIGIRKIEGGTDYELLILDPAKDGSAINKLLGRAFELPKTIDAVAPLILEMSQLANKDCQLLMATKRPLVDLDVAEMKERINAVTAARESVVKQLGIAPETEVSAERK